MLVAERMEHPPAMELHRPLRMVVVDDSADLLFLMKLRFDDGPEGQINVVQTFSSAIDAMEWDGWDDVDICLTDLTLGRRPWGDDLIRWLYSNYPRILTVLVSSGWINERIKDLPDIAMDRADLDGIREAIIRRWLSR